VQIDRLAEEKRDQLFVKGKGARRWALSAPFISDTVCRWPHLFLAQMGPDRCCAHANAGLSVGVGERRALGEVAQRARTRPRRLRALQRPHLTHARAGPTQPPQVSAFPPSSSCIRFHLLLLAPQASGRSWAPLHSRRGSTATAAARRKPPRQTRSTGEGQGEGQGQTGRRGQRVSRIARHSGEALFIFYAALAQCFE